MMTGTIHELVDAAQSIDDFTLPHHAGNTALEQADEAAAIVAGLAEGLMEAAVANLKGSQSNAVVYASAAIMFERSRALSVFIEQLATAAARARVEPVRVKGRRHRSNR